MKKTEDLIIENKENGISIRLSLDENILNIDKEYGIPKTIYDKRKILRLQQELINFLEISESILGKESNIENKQVSKLFDSELKTISNMTEEEYEDEKRSLIDSFLGRREDE